MRGDWALDSLDLDIEVFQGPFDLLLSLILREEVSIFEVPLAEIVISYLERLEDNDELDLEAASEFLILMSALLEIKSARLLPRPEELDLDELTPEEARDELLLRLITYRQFKQAAAWLHRRYSTTRLWRFRQAPLPKVARRVKREVPYRYEPSRLVESLAVLLAGPPRINTGHMARITVSIWEQMKEIRAALSRKRQVSFEDIAGEADRMTQAVTFFALLEMYNSGELELEQEHLFGRILIQEATRKKIA
jgi:segregation and condensation protein A